MGEGTQQPANIRSRCLLETLQLLQDEPAGSDAAGGGQSWRVRLGIVSLHLRRGTGLSEESRPTGTEVESEHVCIHALINKPFPGTGVWTSSQVSGSGF